MADEPTDTQNSPTPSPAPDADQGATDAPKPTDDGASGDDDQSLLGSADTGAGDDGKGGDKDGADDKDAAAEAEPPETYELKVTTKDAEGKDVEVEIDQALLTEATPVLKDLKLTNEQANKLAPLALKVQQRVLTQQADNFTALKTDWAKAAKEDAEIGGKNWPQTEALAAKALDTFGATKGSEFRNLLDETGLGNHPAMIRMFRSIGEAVGEDASFIRGDAQQDQKKPREAVLYPNDIPKTGKE